MLASDLQAEAVQDCESVRLFGDAAFNAVGRISINLVGIFVLPVMLHKLGQSVYGVWLSAMAFTSFLATVDLGMGWAVIREAAAAKAGSTELRTFLRSALLVFLISAVSGAVIIGCIGRFSQSRLQVSGLDRQSVAVVFAMVGVGFAGEWLFTYVQALLFGIRRFDVWNAMLITTALVRAAGVIWLLTIGRVGIVGVAIWHASISLGAASVGLLIAGQKVKLFELSGSWFSGKSLRERLSFGIFSQAAALAASGLWQSGPIVLGYAGSMSAVTSFGVGQRLPTALSGLGASLSETVFPAAAQHQSEDGQAQSREILLDGTRWTLLPILPASLVLFAIGPSILSAWIGYSDVAANTVIRLMILAIAADAAASAAMHLLWGQGRSRLLFGIYGVSTALALVAMVIVARTYGAVGIASCVLAGALLYAPFFLLSACRQTGTSIVKLLAHALRGNGMASLLSSVVAFVVFRLAPGSVAHRLIPSLSLAVVIWAFYMATFGLSTEELTLLRASKFATSFRKRDWLRITFLFLQELKENWEGGRRHDLIYHDRLYEREDPFRYSHEQYHKRRYQTVLELVRRRLEPIGQKRVCELGCSEGTFTAQLENLGGTLLAVDFSKPALQRAKSLKQWRSTTEFRSYDLLGRKPLPGSFDVVVAMHVVEFARRYHNRRARKRIVESLRPGGYLVLDSQRRLTDLEESWVRRYFYRGKWLNRFFAEHPQLEVVEEIVDDRDVITVYRRRTA